ncbi:MAG: endolytic transglycosylase MltG [Campylobacteraceae bacterium]|nr:endolytic transglycosylase MltG [Campylobacteraceae bacterium]
MTMIVRMIFAIFDIILIFILTFLSDITAPTSFKGEIFIPKGSATKIISELSKQNLNSTPFDPKILAFIGVPQSGYLDLGDESLSKIDLFYKLTTAKPQMINITLIPGETTVIFLEELAIKNSFDFLKLESEYNKTAPFYEGFLVPETYSMAKGLNETETIQNLVKKSRGAHEKLSKEQFGDFNTTKWLEILTKASVIQKEAADVSEMKIVSSVIDNRLKKGMKLQMDGTLNYGRYSHVRITPERIKNDTSKFNTYLHDGLPESPVCTVSKDAIIAAIKPEESEFLYFMRDRATGKHVFTKTYKEHVNEINRQKNR